jgi:hypothetical protein
METKSTNLDADSCGPAEPPQAFTNLLKIGVALQVEVFPAFRRHLASWLHIEQRGVAATRTPMNATQDN